MAKADPAQSATPVPLGPHNAIHYGKGVRGYEFFAAVERTDGIPIGACFCGRPRPFLGNPGCGSISAWCPCGIGWSAIWGRTGWTDYSRHDSRPAGVVA